MPWFWGSNDSETEDDYDSNEYYTDEEYSSEEDYDSDDKDDQSEQGKYEKDREPKTPSTAVENRSKDKPVISAETDKAFAGNSFQKIEVSSSYENYDWDELPEDIQKAAHILGYTAIIWESDEEPQSSGKNWDQLSSDERTAAQKLGYDKKQWDGDDVVSRSSGSASDSSSSFEEEEEDDESVSDYESDDNEKVNDTSDPNSGQKDHSFSIQVETVDEDSSDDEETFLHDKSFESHHDDDTDSEDDEDNDKGEVTSFWDKQSLLLLAAEHDRVDILKAILNDEKNNEEDKNALMNSGIPPLHIAISFGSTNTTQSLLRMGADPSIRPNVAQVKEQQNQNSESKVEIQNMNRFDGISAWELAFGNAAYEKVQSKDGSGSSWPLFGSSNEANSNYGESPIIRPIKMQPSKREGICHAFTAEALRCIGGDEVDRLKELLRSGMPHTIDIGGKDLYGWAVEMGALKSEEVLRPAEAAKYKDDHTEDAPLDTANHPPSDAASNGLVHRARVLNRSRPGEDESVPQLHNRLDELESLATALSTCLDNLAEEVSVCHGLLLMSGGASALASHVRSLKSLREQKFEQLAQAQVEWHSSDSELADLVLSTGDVGKEIERIAPSNFLEIDKVRPDKNTDTEKMEGPDEDSQRFELRAQIAAIENKIRKLRASIADLSDESTRDLKEVERRGLSGGIDLVRSIREELRDVDFQLSEAKTMAATCRAKIALINHRMPHTKVSAEAPSTKTSLADASTNKEESNSFQAVTGTAVRNETNISPPQALPQRTKAFPGKAVPNEVKSTSEQIASGDSHALIIPGKRGSFKIDIWQVILRIIGMDRAANRRAIELAQKKQQNVHVMTV